jgi:hypothetical protein
MKRFLSVAGMGLLTATGIATATGVKSAVARAAVTPTAAACTPGTWTQESVPVKASEVNGNLDADTIVSATDAWAVGNYYESGGGPFGSLWEHWNGTDWTQVTNGGANVGLAAVTNFGPDDVIAVGQNKDGALIAHWNGTTVVRDRIRGGKLGYLNDVSGSSASDVWAEGTINKAGGVEGVLLYHYNGTTWTLETGLTGNLSGQGIVDHAPNDVEVAASDETTGLVNIYKYNGSTWSIVLSGTPLNFYGDEHGIAGDSDSDLYGHDETDGIDHWNGTSWSHVGPAAKNANIYGIAEGPTGTVWGDGNIDANAIYVTKDGARQTDPPSIMEQPNRLLDGIATGFGLVIAVSTDNFVSTPNLPIALLSCD